MKRSSLFSLVIFTILLLSMYVPATHAANKQFNTNKEEQSLILYKKSMDKISYIIDMHLTTALKYDRLHERALLEGNLVLANEYSKIRDKYLQLTVDYIYNNYRMDVNNIINGIASLTILLSEKKPNEINNILAKSGWKDTSELTAKMEKMRLQPVIAFNMAEEIRKLANNDMFVYTFVSSMVYDEFKELKLKEDTELGLPSSHYKEEKLYTIIQPDSILFPRLTVSFKQVKADTEIAFGQDCSGYPYITNLWQTSANPPIYIPDPKNTLKKVIVHDYSDYSNGWYYYKLELVFGDEDVPFSPAANYAYDMYRLGKYHRIEDIESFVLNSYDRGQTWHVDFQDIWSNGKTFAYPVGQHGSVTRVVRSGSVSVYVSNVWNHAMDIYNSNPCMSIVTVNPPVSWS